jgi:hypothetical protein
LSQGAAFKEILSESDGRFGGFYLTKHRWKNRVAILEYVDSIPANDGSVCERFKRREKRSISKRNLRYIGNGAHLGASDEQQ